MPSAPDKNQIERLHASLKRLGYEIHADEARTKTLGDSTKTALQDVQRRAGLRATGTLTQRTSDALDAALNEAAGRAHVPERVHATYTVSGVVTSPDSASVAGLALRVVDKNVGSDVVVAEGETGSGGAFVVHADITPATLEERRKPRPDLQVLVVDGEDVLARSAVAYDAAPEVTLNVALPAGTTGLPSEYETVTAAIGSLFHGAPSELVEDDQRQDITYLANKTGWDARSIAMAAAADQLRASGASDLHPAFYYALFRAGLPAEADTLHRTPTSVVKSVWADAIAQGVLPAAFEGDVPAAVEAFQATAITGALTARPTVGPSTLGELLTPALGKDTARQQRFAELYTLHQDDTEELWRQTEDAFGADVAARLQLDGKLAYLTINNAPLMAALHHVERDAPLVAPADLASRGYHDAAAWSPLVQKVDVPTDIAGDTEDERRAAYAEVLAAQVRLSFPTATVAHLVNTGAVPLVNSEAQPEVARFLEEHRDAFDIGGEPVAAFAARTNAGASTEVIGEITRIQRVYQLTNNNAAMGPLLAGGADSAFAITRLGKAEFTDRFAAVLGGEAAAAATFARAEAVHASILHLAIAFLGAKAAPSIGAGLSDNVMDLFGGWGQAATTTPAQATLDDLFGNLDYCACDECQSVISPAAYLVDLLQWINPQNSPSDPFAVLDARRPDIAALPLTCDNTNIALPYIDLVNETLEYYVKGNTLTGYAGHNTDGSISSSDLIASPQNDDDAIGRDAYALLKDNWFPAPLPFHRDLELLRRHVQRLGPPLHEVMATLRAGDAMTTPTPADPTTYGWRDILAERLGLSGAEYQLLTDGSLTLQEVYGYAPGTDVVAEMSVLQEFSRRMSVSYDDIVSILRTTFINSGARLIPLLEMLGVDVQTLEEVAAGTMPAATFAAKLPATIDPRAYGCATRNDIAGWVQHNHDAILHLIVIDVDGSSADPCDAAAMHLRYFDPSLNPNALSAFDFVRLLRFVRLWQKLGLSIAATDAVLNALYIPTGAVGASDIDKLDGGLKTALSRAGLAYEVIELLGLDPASDLASVLTCWSNIGTEGGESLYSRMFLNPTVLQRAGASDFAPGLDGRVLASTTPPPLLDHKDVICAALNLTSDEFDLLTGASTTAAPGLTLGLGYDAATPLTLDGISAIYRRSWLARALQMSVVEFLSLVEVTGIDPFALPSVDDGTALACPLRDFVVLVQGMNVVGLAPSAALFLLWDVDLAGAKPAAEHAALALVTTLRSSFAAIDAQFAVGSGVSLDTAKRLMAQVKGAAVADVYFALLGDSFVTSVPLAFSDPVLPAAVLNAAADGRLGYDDMTKQLTYRGSPDAAVVAAMVAAAGGAASLVAAINALQGQYQTDLNAFFANNDDTAGTLHGLFSAFLASTDPVDEKVSLVLRSLLPALALQRKQAQALTEVVAAAGCDPSYASALLANASFPGATDALAAIGDCGLRAAFFSTNDPNQPPDATAATATLTYNADDPLRPATFPAGQPFAAQWTGYLNAPADGTYEIQLVADAGAAFDVSLPGSVGGVSGAATWTASIAMTAGALVPVEITVTGLSETFAARWRAAGQGWQSIPSSTLFADRAVAAVHDVYLRFLKTTVLATSLTLTAADAAFLATRPELAMGGHTWLTAVPLEVPANAADRTAWRPVLETVVAYAQLKANHPASGDRFVAAIQDLLTTGTTSADGALGWDSSSLAILTPRLVGVPTLTTAPQPIRALGRLDAAFALCHTTKLSVPTLITAATNDPSPDAVANFQSALRSRYEASDWRNAIQPINDELRELQRDALVAYILVHAGTQILNELGVGTSKNRVPTAEDLFNYFLMDVEMEPCMETSRVRHALSAVQLFIERALRNLEPKVNPGKIDPDEWQWRKRYRVWQANREVFLWPENWLDPTLRDDQSPIFKTTLSQLLQSDITADTAASAYLDYLSGLEQVAKLEPCGLYYQPAAGDKGEVAHAVARTSGAHRKHYYRRLEDGAWTAWEEIKLQIDDLPVTPYVWNNRLMLFWLQIHQQSSLDPSAMNGRLPTSGSTKELGAAHLGDLTGRMEVAAADQGKMRVSAVLCFSEYHNGKWQPMKTSSVDRSLYIGDYTPGTFDASDVALRPWTSIDANDGSLYLQVAHKNDQLPTGLLETQIFTGFLGPINNFIPEYVPRHGFVVHNTHSAPLRWADTPLTYLRAPAKSRLLTTFGSDANSPWHLSQDDSGASPFDILTGHLPQTVRAPEPNVDDQQDMPFFFEDARNAFYVTSSAPFISLLHYDGFGVHRGGGARGSSVPRIPSTVVGVGTVRPGEPVERTIDRGDPMDASVRLGAKARSLIGSQATFSYGKQAIGSVGAVANVEQERGNR